MKSPSRPSDALLPFVSAFLLAAAGEAKSATRGGLETFESPNNAQSWAVYDDSDGNDYFPFWNSDPLSGDPDIYFFFTNDSSFLFFADAVSSDGAFVGNYAAAKIAGLGCNLFIEDFESFDGADIFFYSDFDGRFYYSRFFDTATYFVGSGWDTIETALLGGSWFVFQSGGFVPATLTPASLQSVSQVGVRCFPLDVTADATIIALDNFYLIPELTAPSLQLDETTTGTLSGDFVMTSGQAYNLWSSDNLLDWVRLEDFSDLTGVGTVPFDVPVPPDADAFLYLSTEEAYTAIPDIGP